MQVADEVVNPYIRLQVIDPRETVDAGNPTRIEPPDGTDDDKDISN